MLCATVSVGCGVSHGISAAPPGLALAAVDEIATFSTKCGGREVAVDEMATFSTE